MQVCSLQPFLKGSAMPATVFDVCGLKEIPKKYSVKQMKSGSELRIAELNLAELKWKKQSLDEKFATADKALFPIELSAKAALKKNYDTAANKLENEIYAAEVAILPDKVAGCRQIKLDFLEQRRKNKNVAFPVPHFIAFALDNPVWRMAVCHEFMGENAVKEEPLFRNRYRDVCKSMRGYFWTIAHVADTLLVLSLTMSLASTICSILGLVTCLIAGWSLGAVFAQVFVWSAITLLSVFCILCAAVRKTVGSTLTLESRFDGTIPAKVRERMQRFLDQEVFEEVFLIAEAPVWKLDTQTSIVPNTDPLAIGRRGVGFYLIDVFDTTSAEDYVAKAFLV